MLQRKLKNTLSKTEVRSAFSDEMPKYQTIKNDIITMINRGYYKEGQRIDSVRTLASHYNVSIQVIQMAIAELESLEYVCTVPKSGMYVNPQKKSGPFNKIGIFIRKHPIYDQGKILESLGHMIRKYDYIPVVGGDWDEPYTLDEWLDSKSLDGVFLLGVLEEDDITPLIRHRLPYLVLGNHNIDSSHPQMTLDVYAISYKIFRESLACYKGKKLGAVFGFESSRGDRERRQAMVDAWRAINDGVVDESLFRFSTIDGYDEALSLISEENLDLFFTCDGPMEGYRRYRFLHPDTPQPTILSFIKPGSNRPDYVTTLPYRKFDYDYAKAVRLLVRMIQKS